MRDDILRITAAEPRLVIGLMSGTSADGIDAALVQVSGFGASTRWQLLEFVMTPFTADFRAEILAIQDPRAERVLPRLSALNYRLGDVYADACHHLVAKADRRLDDIYLIGCHGQTVFHETGHSDRTDFVRSTYQAFEPQVLAERTGIPVISNFRARDVAAGGTGAPLVPLMDWLLFRSPDRNRVCLNLGGIANITILPKGAERTDVTAFDTGPASMVIDALISRATDGAQHFDVGGTVASSASPDADFLDHLMAHPYFAAPPPKSCGRDEFGAEYVQGLLSEAERRGLSPDTVISTLTTLTARSVAEAIGRATTPDEVIAAGGGTHNTELMRRLADELHQATGVSLPFTTTAAHGLDPDAKEAVAFALLANESVHGQPGNLPSVTGARHPVVLGTFTPGARR
jgi:anhydro-N-acetylmuramic acid kinase